MITNFIIFGVHNASPNEESMTIEEVNESVEVISHYDGKSMRPIRFKWRGRAYQVSHINGVWDDIKGQSREYHFHVSAKNSGSFELIYNNAGFTWKLGRICLDD